MSIQDAVKWNQRYQTPERSVRATPRLFLTEQAAALPRHGLALDVAMGLGCNATYLAARGLRVIGLDISEVAVRIARARCTSLNVAVVDLSHFTLPPATFDGIVNFYFLDRRLWPVYRQALKPGGVLIMETLTQAMRHIRPDIDPVQLLQPGELHTAFHDWEIVTYREGWINQENWHRAVASLVARRC